jgi:hypothetical protein
MKRAVIYIAIMLGLFVTCNAQKIEQGTICGTFYKLVKWKGYNTSYTLELNADSTFKLHITLFEGSSQCIGKWEILDSVFIMLKCNEDTNPYEMLTSGYMSEKEHKLQVINKNKIKYKDVVLKRKK